MGMDVPIKKLESEGWSISESGINVITQNGDLKDYRVILQNVLDTDLKEIGRPVLADILSKKCIDCAVLQIQKVRNVSAPKANEESQGAPRMLKLTLSDGHITCQAIEYDSIPKLSIQKTAPGSKVLLTKAKILNGYVILNSSSCSYLGGVVPAMYEKWELNKNMSNYKRGGGNCDGDGPPPWINFGKKISPGFEDKKDFKSLEVKNKDGKVTEFEQQRQDAIAEAASGAVKKFGGGVKAAIQNEALKSDLPVRNNDYNRERNFKGRNKREPREKMVEEKQQKPSEKVSLFDFLEDKLPVKSDLETANNNRMGRQYNPVNKDRAPRFNSNSAREPYESYNRQPQNNYNNRNDSYDQNRQNFDSYKYFQPQNSRQPQNHYQPRQPQQPPVNSMERLSLNASFASKAFKQHLNLPSRTNDDFGGPKLNKPPQEGPKEPSGWPWKIGDHCMAKYWDDNKYYNATITALTDKTCVVQFSDYGNIEEVLRADCIPITEPRDEKLETNQYSGGENKRSGNRNYYNKGYNNRYRQDRRN